jgi:hypothetical protein
MGRGVGRSKEADMGPLGTGSYQQTLRKERERAMGETEAESLAMEFPLK